MLTDMDSSYRFDKKYGSNYVRFYFTEDDKPVLASLESEIDLPTFPKYLEIIEIDGGLVFHGCSNGVFYSQGGRSWRKVFNKGLVARMAKIGKYYCSFVSTFKWSRDPGEMVITTDGVDYKTINIDQLPCRVCFNGDKVFLVDERDDKGGMFVGKVEIEQA